MQTLGHMYDMTFSQCFQAQMARRRSASGRGEGDA